MANVLFTRTSDPNSKPVTDGQLIFDTSGNGKMYLDNGTDRLEMGGAVTVDDALSKTSTNAIQNKAVTGNILNSLAEVSAATQQNTIAGALALKEVNSSLGGLSFTQDEKGNWGYKPSGADTVIPFKGSTELKQLTCTSNNYGQAVFNTEGYKNILIFDYATQWNFSSVSNGDIVFKNSHACQANNGTPAGSAYLIFVSNVSTSNLYLNRSGGGTGALRTPIAYGF